MKQRGVGVGSVFHARLVAAQQRRRHALGHGEIDEFARARECTVHDLNRVGVLRIGQIGLQVVLGHVRGIRYAAIHESQLPAKRHEALDLRCREEILDFQEHVSIRILMQHQP